MLSPMDIRDKSFNVKMRGFDQDQVNDFLDQIIADYEGALKKVETLTDSLKEAQDKVTHYEGMENAMNQAIIVAQDAADRLKTTSEEDAQKVQDEAEKNAEQILSEASDKSNKILADASDKARQLTIQSEDMRRNAQDFRDHLALLLRAELETIEGDNWSDTIGKTPEDAKKGLPDESTLIPDELQETPLDSDGDDSLNSGTDAKPETADADAANAAAGDDDYTQIVFPDDPIA
ncbi:DivIVA domain-containing protein [Lacticaseibacillus songhuajiangensis]|uniref:DivIVA domain-containing protein n=1 Tax=Lacticaseibacillus songhuajiangensis TaxID=1296539 RepID=UPI000F768D4B|nr:DivIVA domain-containing protein [Lacticaseibacillus songhuajiangensis]